MFKFKKPAPHLGASRLNSPGYSHRPGTPERAEADTWYTQYNQWLTSTIGKGDKSE